MNEIQASRLLTLANYLRECVKEEQFDLRTIACGLDIHACGTTACALGWATVVWPDVFRLKWGSSRVLLDVDGESGRGVGNEKIQAWFGLVRGDCIEMFGEHRQRTNIQQADFMERAARSAGWVRA